MQNNDKQTITVSSDLHEQIRQWVESAEGKRAIEDSLEKAQAMSFQLREAQRVNPESLNRPVTI